MNFEGLIERINGDTWNSLALFRPELTLCATIVLILLLRIFRATSWIDSFYLFLVGAAAALAFAVAPWAEAGSASAIHREPLFTGMLVYDGFTVYFRIVLLLFAVLFGVFTRISGIPDRDAGTDVYPLVLGATLGLCVMASANHLLMIFMGVEMASVPSYVLAGLLKGRRQSSEAALKYAIYGAGTAGIMLYGLSLLGGALGSYHLPTMAAQLADVLRATELDHEINGAKISVLLLGGLMVMVGLAFKLSAVPFHFWCPDVFEGASAEVNAFLSVASKAGALALLVRVAIGMSTLAPTGAAHHLNPFGADSEPGALSQPAGLQKNLSGTKFSVADDGTDGVPPKTEKPASVPSRLAAAPGDWLAPARTFIGNLLAFVAVITCTFGNLAAYGQTNIKRLLAYSTIAHAGYMIMPVAAALTLANTDPGAAQKAIGALNFYVVVYLFMNLGAFAMVAFLRNILRSEEIADYAGLIRRMPVPVVCFSLLLFSLIGLPPLGGFIGKFMIFAALVDARMWTVLVIGGLNTALSLFYYLRVVKVMTMDPEPEQRTPVDFQFIPGTFVVALTLPVVVWGLWFDGLNQWALRAATHLFS